MEPARGKGRDAQTHGRFGHEALKHWKGRGPVPELQAARGSKRPAAELSGENGRAHDASICCCFCYRVWFCYKLWKASFGPKLLLQICIGEDGLRFVHMV